jgi:transposase
MTGARFVHDTLECCGWHVEVADAEKVKGLAPLACKTDRIDSMVLATLSQRDLVPSVWLPDPRVREQRELARFRLHLVKHKSMLKNRVHSSLISFGKPCPVTDLFGVEGRELLELMAIPEPWRGDITASVEPDRSPRTPDRSNQQAAQVGSRQPPLHSAADERPRVNQSGDKDRRGPLTKHGPTYLRWALLEATMHALKHPAYAQRYQRNRRRLGTQRGAKVAQVDIARRLAHAIWHMLSRNQQFAPRGATFRLAA